MSWVFAGGRQGWSCPGCSRCYSPDVMMCWFCPAGTYRWIWQPSNPYGTGVAPLTVGDGVIPLTFGGNWNTPPVNAGVTPAVDQSWVYDPSYGDGCTT